MWFDKALYWAWYGGSEGYTKPPTEKKIDYQTVYLTDGDNRYSMQIAVGVWDDDKYNPYGPGIKQVNEILAIQNTI